MQTISKPKFSYLYYDYVRNPKLLLIFALTVFLFFNLTFATPQIIMISSVYASSNNKEGDEYDLEESIRQYTIIEGLVKARVDSAGSI